MLVAKLHVDYDGLLLLHIDNARAAIAALLALLSGAALEDGGAQRQQGVHLAPRG